MSAPGVIGLELVCPMSCVHCETEFEFTVAEALHMYAGQGMARCPGCGAGYSVSHPFLLAFIDEAVLDAWRSDPAVPTRVYRVGLLTKLGRGPSG